MAEDGGCHQDTETGPNAAPKILDTIDGSFPSPNAHRAVFRGRGDAPGTEGDAPGTEGDAASGQRQVLTTIRSADESDDDIAPAAPLGEFAPATPSGVEDRNEGMCSLRIISPRMVEQSPTLCQSSFRKRYQHLSQSSRLVKFSSDMLENVMRGSTSESDESDESDMSDESTDGEDGKDFPEDYFEPLRFSGEIDERPVSSPPPTMWRMISDLASTLQRSPKEEQRYSSGKSDKARNDGGEVCDFSHTLSSRNLAVLARNNFRGIETGEVAPLLPKNAGSAGKMGAKAYLPKPDFEPDYKVEERAAEIAAAFLKDYERSRACTLPENVDSISDSQIFLHRFRFSTGWKATLYISAGLLFLASQFENGGNWTALRFLTYTPMLVFVLDMFMFHHFKQELNKTNNNQDSSASLNDETHSVHARKGRSRQWRPALIFMFMAMVFETSFTCYDTRSVEALGGIIYSGTLKPAVVFYLSSNARDALEALGRVGPVVFKVIVMELFIILSFAAVATNMYYESVSFSCLSDSFVSLFELSTTVVNPSLWMPLYDKHRTSAIFFIAFVITSVFYLHSLVLSVVFQTYMKAVKNIRDRSYSDREDNLRLAFQALEGIDKDEKHFPAVRSRSVRKTLALMRPHYKPAKIDALLHTIDPACAGVIDYVSFRNKMPKALNTSLRSTRDSSLAFELFAAFVAVANLIFVFTVSYPSKSLFWDRTILPIGSIITLMGILEVLLRLDPFRLLPIVPPTRLDRTFDGLALLAGAMSFYGIFLHFTGVHSGAKLEFILIGRAIDMMRIVRFFGIFRDIVHRSGDVLPAISGPVLMVFSAVHIFTYAGRILWSGAVDVGAHKDVIDPFYDLNNFDDYLSGMVTMFQVLVVNDWHAIAEVYLHANRCSHPLVVYPFFIGANLFSVSVLLNVLTAFFVGAFVVTRLDSVTSERAQPENLALSIRPSSSLGILSAAGQSSVRLSAKSSLRSASEFHAFERQGFDKIMETVTGENSAADGWAKRTCEILEIFESLTPRLGRVGYLVCCSQSEDRFGNRRFQTLTKDFLEDDVMHMIVSDMHSDLISKAAAGGDKRDLIVTRSLSNHTERLELSASLLSTSPPTSLFVADVMSDASSDNMMSQFKTSDEIPNF